MMNKKGFVILYAVVVAGVVSLSGILLSNIVLKQLILSSIGRETQFAYYAANIGDDCARQGLFRIDNGGRGSFGRFEETGFGGGEYEFGEGDGILLCKDQPISINYIRNDSDLKIIRFSNDTNSDYYFIVDVTIKEDGSRYVTSRGYNMNPDDDHPRQVEKVIYRDYSPNN